MGALDGKLALVTGASRGIGYHCALELASEGAHVIATARTVGGLEELDDDIRNDGGQATLVPHDLTDLDGIDRLGASVYERWGKLDILVGNAGILGGLSPVEHIDVKTFDKVFKLNVAANWRLMRSMSPLLRQSEAGRAVFMISDMQDVPKPFWAVYQSSQAALKTLVQTWAAENLNTSLRINLLNPGPVRTALRAEAMPGENKETLSHPSDVAKSLLPLVQSDQRETGRVFDYLSLQKP